MQRFICLGRQAELRGRVEAGYPSHHKFFPYNYEP